MVLRDFLNSVSPTVKPPPNSLSPAGGRAHQQPQTNATIRLLAPKCAPSMVTLPASLRTVGELKRWLVGRAESLKCRLDAQCAAREEQEFLAETDEKRKRKKPHTTSGKKGVVHRPGAPPAGPPTAALMFLHHLPEKAFHLMSVAPPRQGGPCSVGSNAGPANNSGPCSVGSNEVLLLDEDPLPWTVTEDPAAGRGPSNSSCSGSSLTVDDDPLQDSSGVRTGCFALPEKCEARQSAAQRRKQGSAFLWFCLFAHPAMCGCAMCRVNSSSPRVMCISTKETARTELHTLVLTSTDLC